MTNIAISKQARRAAQQATLAAQQELARRTRANMEDLALFFAAREREDKIEERWAERVAKLREEATRRRDEERVTSGRALAAMRDRGEALCEVAQMAGVTERTVRELIRAAKAAGPAQPPSASPDESVAPRQRRCQPRQTPGSTAEPGHAAAVPA
ncbi:hypothetical protein [Mycobacterium asiaticum]|uniref:Uncharacterized protein n=1 Tax=Mycobacterium asiaticum TaxID=1790 RepID=A0A1A3KXA5_MYCAS|nr:hypothetical protein [Mycobacterium asiaticum]OBJ89852.1 hypothetical protein A5640_24890 [Mycobacterium asiaticum]